MKSAIPSGVSPFWSCALSVREDMSRTGEAGEAGEASEAGEAGEVGVAGEAWGGAVRAVWRCGAATQLLHTTSAPVYVTFSPEGNARLQVKKQHSVIFRRGFPKVA